MHTQFGRCSDLPSSIPWVNICPISNTHIQTDMQRVCMHCLVDVQTFPAPFHGRTYVKLATQTNMQRVCMHCFVDVQTFPAPCHGRTYVQLATHTHRLTCNECACTVWWMCRPSQLHSMGEHNVKLATHTYRHNECACTVWWMFRPSQLHSMGERMQHTDMQQVCMHCLVDVQTFPAPFHGRTYVKIATHTYRLICNECACTVW